MAVKPPLMGAAIAELRPIFAAVLSGPAEGVCPSKRGTPCDTAVPNAVSVAIC